VSDIKDGFGFMVWKIYKNRKGLLLVTFAPVGLSTNLFVGRKVINRFIGDCYE